MYKFGYVALLGLPNAGKSTLVNRLVGMNLAITSAKPQTTRDNMLAVVTDKNYQLAFIDTPGLHKAGSHLDKYMMKNVRTAKAGADVVVYLIDSTVGKTKEEEEHILSMKKAGINVIIAASKCDKKMPSFAADIVFSAKTGEGIDKLIEMILSKLEPSKSKNFVFDEDEITDKPVKFLVGEYVRESVLKTLKKEVPHGVAVVVTKFDEQKNIIRIEADIICERETHKGIIIGKGGATLKKIGTLARESSEELLQKKVMLSLFVKVEEDWKDRPNKLKNLGYN